MSTVYKLYSNGGDGGLRRGGGVRHLPSNRPDTEMKFCYHSMIISGGNVPSQISPHIFLGFWKDLWWFCVIFGSVKVPFFGVVVAHFTVRYIITYADVERVVCR